MRRLVRGLAGVWLIDVGADERLSLTEMGALLRSGTAGSMRDLALPSGFSILDCRVSSVIRTPEDGSAHWARGSAGGMVESRRGLERLER
jgi:hypothetical protein